MAYVYQDAHHRRKAMACRQLKAEVVEFVSITNSDSEAALGEYQITLFIANQLSPAFLFRVKAKHALDAVRIRGVLVHLRFAHAVIVGTLGVVTLDGDNRILAAGVYVDHGRCVAISPEKNGRAITYLGYIADFTSHKVVD